MLGDRAIEGVGVALLEVTAAAAPHQQGVAGEGHGVVVEHKGEAAIGVTGGGAHLQLPAAEADAIAAGQGAGHVFSPGGGGQANGAARGLVHQPAAGHMVGVGMGVEAGHQLNAQFPDQGQVAVVLLEHRIDQHPLARAPIGQQVGEGAGVGIKKLAQQQGGPAGGGPEQGRGQRGRGGRGRGGGGDSHGQCLCSCYECTRINGIEQGGPVGWALGGRRQAARPGRQAGPGRHVG